MNHSAYARIGASPLILPPALPGDRRSRRPAPRDHRVRAVSVRGAMAMVALISLAGCAALTRLHRDSAFEKVLQDDVKDLGERTARAEEQRSADGWRDVAARVVKLETQLAADLDGPCTGPKPDKN